MSSKNKGAGARSGAMRGTGRGDDNGVILGRWCLKEVGRSTGDAGTRREERAGKGFMGDLGGRETLCGGRDVERRKIRSAKSAGGHLRNGEGNLGAR